MVAILSDRRSTWRYHRAGEKSKSGKGTYYISPKAKHSGKNQPNRCESVVELMMLEVIVKSKTADDTVSVLHLLKHNKSRSQFVEEKNITKSKAEAIGS